MRRKAETWRDSVRCLSGRASCQKARRSKDICGLGRTNHSGPELVRYGTIFNQKSGASNLSDMRHGVRYRAARHRSERAYPLSLLPRALCRSRAGCSNPASASLAVFLKAHSQEPSPAAHRRANHTPVLRASALMVALARRDLQFGSTHGSGLMTRGNLGP